MASNFNFIDFYIRYPGHPDYIPLELIEDDVVKVIIQKYEMILFTNKGEVLGEPNFGGDLTLLLHETKLSSESIQGDLMAQIRACEKEADLNSLEKPLNYFKRIKLDGVIKAASKQNALDQAKEMALKIQDEGVAEEMKERLKTILNILEIKKYLANDLPINKDRLKIIDVPDI